MKLLTSESTLSKINAALNAMREELDEHRESINETTNEIQANYEYLLRLDEKIEKLNEKIGTLMMTRQKANEQQQIELTEQEKAVFLLIYCSSEKPLSYAEIAESLDQSELLVANYVTNMIEKGIPIRKRYLNHTVFLELDKEFRDLQAKHNILRINQTTMKQFA